MLSVLVVEDDTLKFGRVHDVLTQFGINPSEIYHSVTASEALLKLSAVRCDLMLLDINLPRRLGEEPHRGGGMLVLRELERDNHLNRPTYIVGSTAYDDLAGEFGPEFEESLWSVLRYAENSDEWKSQLIGKLRYILAAKESRRFSDGVTFGYDLAIVSALEDLEHGAVRQLACDWSPLRLPHDETRYITGSFVSGDNRRRTVIAGAAPRMGMPAASVLSSKIIQQFRPQILLMVGICAGRKNEVSIGDVIVADPAWDCGSGKIISTENGARFQPEPHQLDLDPDIAAIAKELAKEKAFLAQIKSEFYGPKPGTELSGHVGPLASGSAVVTDPTTFNEILPQHRKLLGIEMEAYGVVAAARGNGKPRPEAIVVKAVSDYADEKKSDNFQMFSALNSAKFGLELAKRVLAGRSVAGRS